MHDIQSLQHNLPLGAQWDSPELFTATTEIGAWAVNVACWRTVHRDTGEEVTASSARMSDSPHIEAYFELLERTAIVDFRPSGDQQFYFDGAGKPVRGSTLPLSRRSPDPDAWQFARSNGIAGHADAVVARRLARSDLLEHDRVLRSWYGEIKPQPRPYKGEVLLSPWYRFRAFSFAVNQQPEVAGVFGFPLNKDAPFICGFGAGENWSEAVAGAQASCFQRLGFLWGEDLPPGEIPFSPTPLYHQEIYLSENGWRRVESWLDGSHVNIAKPRLPWFERENTLFYDLTPEHLRGRWNVMGAFSEQAFPLFFGRCSEYVPDAMPPDLWVHPVA